MAIDKDSAFVEAVIKFATKQVMSTLVARSAFFAFGPVNFFVSMFVAKFLSFVIGKTIIGVNIFLIRQSLKKEVKEFNELLEAYDKEPDPTKREEIEDKIVENARDIIRINTNEL